MTKQHKLVSNFNNWETGAVLGVYRGQWENNSKW